VTLVDGRGIGAGASGRNSGVVQHPFDPALRELYRATAAAYRGLAVEGGHGLALPIEPVGLLLVSLDPSAPRRMATELAMAWPELQPEYVDPESLDRIEPGLAPAVSACRVRVGYPVPPEAATRAFADLAGRSGARLRLGTAVAGLLRHGDRLTGVRLADGTTLSAGAVLVAAGPWSPALIDPTGRWRPIRPVWGVVVDIGLADPPRHVLEEAEMDAALGDGTPIPSGPVGGPTDQGGSAERPEFSLVTAAGRSSLGSTFLELEPEPVAWIPRLVAHGRRFVPTIARGSIGPVRACARPVAADGRPLVGPVPGLRGAFLAAGHGPWGISTGPASARLVADAILGLPASVPRELAADRFGQPG
jgi:D-hydroxyproline dehydrogenase subunit beta